MTKKKIVLERTFKAPLEDVWELWTTKEGIESWWGPEGFRVEVRKLDLRPGGVLQYAMIAVGAEQIAFMKQAKMSTITEATINYTEVIPRKRLAYTHAVDFVPGITSYDTGTVVELEQTSQGVKLVLTLDPMHDEEWTGRMSSGWDSELGKLEKLLKGKY